MDMPYFCSTMIDTSYFGWNTQTNISEENGWNTAKNVENTKLFLKNIKLENFQKIGNFGWKKLKLLLKSL